MNDVSIDKIIRKYYHSGNISYEGESLNGYDANQVPHGYGVEYYDGKCKRYGESKRGYIKYKGERKDGNYHGKGTLYDNQGRHKYIGTFFQGMPQTDNGLLFNYGIDGYEEQFFCFQGNRAKIQNRVMRHYWTLYHENGNIRYQGYVDDGTPDGEGKWFHKNGNLWFKGISIDGMFAFGELYDEYGILEYKGDFGPFKRNGGAFFNGIGTSYYDNGNIHLDGEFEWGNFIQGKCYTENGKLKFDGIVSPEDGRALVGTMYDEEGNGSPFSFIQFRPK